MRPFVLVATLAFSAAGAVGPAVAMSPISADFFACIDGSGGVTATMRDCYEAEGKRVDEALNREYRSALARLASPQAQQRLRQNQRTWLKTRYRHCAAQAKELEGGTLWLLAMDDCGLNANADRVRWLQGYRG